MADEQPRDLTKKKPWRPWHPCDYTDVVAIALAALRGGTADAEQQKMAMDWILQEACMRPGMSFVPGDEGRRDTDFAEGRRFVGNQIAKVASIPVGKLRRMRNG